MASGASARARSAVASVAPGWLMALVAEGGEPLKITGARVSDNFFTMLGGAAALGRTSPAGDGTPGPRACRGDLGPAVAAALRGRPGRDRAIGAGRPGAHEVIGVMPPASRCWAATELWVPLPSSREPRRPAPRSRSRSAGCAPAPPRAASRELAALVPEMRRMLGRPEDWGRTMRVPGAAGRHDRPCGPRSSLLLVAVGLVLLLGAVNLGTLVLGRSIERARELAVRTAVGASRGSWCVNCWSSRRCSPRPGAGRAGARPGRAAGAGRGLPPEVPRQAEIALDGGVFAVCWRRRWGWPADGAAAGAGRAAAGRPAAAAAAQAPTRRAASARWAGWWPRRWRWRWCSASAPG